MRATWQAENVSSCLELEGVCVAKSLYLDIREYQTNKWQSKANQTSVRDNE